MTESVLVPKYDPRGSHDPRWHVHRIDGYGNRKNLGKIQRPDVVSALREAARKHPSFTHIRRQGSDVLIERLVITL